MCANKYEKSTQTDRLSIKRTVVSVCLHARSAFLLFSAIISLTALEFAWKHFLHIFSHCICNICGYNVSSNLLCGADTNTQTTNLLVGKHNQRHSPMICSTAVGNISKSPDMRLHTDIHMNICRCVCACLWCCFCI